MIGGKETDDGLGIAGGQHGRGQADGGQGVAAGRLAEEPIVGQPRQGFQNRRAMASAGAHAAAVGRHEPFLRT